MADQEESSSRPSFTSFWKKSKEAFGGKSITFVPNAGATASTAQEGNDAEELSAKEKAQIRRQQVRRAQVQHRQRKANYIKQLELDVGRIRDMISQTERETNFLRRENGAMRSRLRQAQLQQQAMPAQIQVPDPIQIQQGIPHDHVNFPPPSATTELFADIDVSNLTVTLSVDETLGTPVYRISSSSSGSTATSAGSPLSVGSPAASEGQSGLSPEEEQTAINFILSLEHICWDHFKLEDFPAYGDDSGNDCGHTLMASAICMNSAPETVFNNKKAIKKASSSKSPAASFSWPLTGLSLQGLYGLASSLNPGDKELTPVQAWFELASRYHTNLLLSPRVLEGLKRELNGVVKCLHFGATMEREAFESVVNRVVGQEPYEATGVAF